ncbi:MAG TPA: lipoyl(octanoyl) transferase LipB [Marinagarivorans sp.]
MTTTPANAIFTPIVVKDLGVVPYVDVWEAMQDFTDARAEEDPNHPIRDELWIVEHEPTYTQGQAGKAEHILGDTPFPVVQTDRGGQVTFHGPGQLVFYPLINLRRKHMGVRDLVTHIENSVIACMASYGVQAEAKANAPGVYVDNKKIASLGLRVRRGCSFHGVGINIDMDLSAFSAINPCGYPELEMTQLLDHIDASEREGILISAKRRYVECLLTELKCVLANEHG